MRKFENATLVITMMVAAFVLAAAITFHFCPRPGTVKFETDNGAHGTMYVHNAKNLVASKVEVEGKLRELHIPDKVTKLAETR